MHVHQLSITYVPEQDRILVRVNTKQGQELQFWFTRRLTLGLIPLLDRAVAEHAARQAGPATSHVAAMDAMSKMAMAQFQRAETLKSSDFTTPYKAPEAGASMFESPLLVTEVNVAPMTKGQMRLSFSERLTGLAEHRSLQMGLTDPLMHAFVHLLERAVAQSQWSGSPNAKPEPHATDPSRGPDKPSYLN
jgi:hypothetical protein